MRVLVFAGLALLASCSETTQGLLSAPVDASSPSDTGIEPEDAGSLADADTSRDANAPPDAGVETRSVQLLRPSGRPADRARLCGLVGQQGTEVGVADDDGFVDVPLSYSEFFAGGVSSRGKGSASRRSLGMKLSLRT